MGKKAAKTSTTERLTTLENVQNNLKTYAQAMKANVEAYLKRLKTIKRVEQTNSDGDAVEYLSITTPNGDTLMHMLCSLSIEDQDRYYELLLEEIDAVPTQINQANNLGYTPLFLAFASGNVDFFAIMITKSNGFDAVISILEFLTDQNDINKFVIFLTKKIPNTDLNIMGVLYSQRPDLVYSIENINRFLEKQSVPKEHLSFVASKTVYMISLMIKKGLDAGTVDCLQLMLEQSDAEAEGSIRKKLSLQIFYSFLENIEGADQYLEQQIDAGVIQGIDHLWAARKCQNKLVAGKLEEKQKQEEQNRKKEEELQKEQQRLAKQQAAEARKVAEKQIEEERNLNFNRNIEELKKVISQKQQDQKWSALSIDPENLKVLLGDYEVLQLSKTNLRKSLWSSGEIEENFVKQIDNKFLEIEQKQKREQDEIQRKVAKMVTQIEFLTAKLSERQSSIAAQLEKQSKPQKGNIATGDNLDLAIKNLDRLKKLPKDFADYGTAETKEIQDIFESCIQRLKISITEAELKKFTEQQAQEQKRKLELDLQTTKRIVDFYTTIGQEVQNGGCFMIMQKTDFANKLADFMLDPQNGFAKNRATHQEKIGQLFSQNPDQSDNLIGVFNFIAKKLQMRNEQISLRSLVGDFVTQEQISKCLNQVKFYADDVDFYLSTVFLNEADILLSNKPAIEKPLEEIGDKNIGVGEKIVDKTPERQSPAATPNPSTQRPAGQSLNADAPPFVPGKIGNITIGGR